MLNLETDIKAAIRDVPNFPKDGILFKDVSTLLLQPNLANRVLDDLVLRYAGSHRYDLEYGTATIELHRDAVHAGQRMLIHDDLLATGGSAEAAARLIQEAGGVVAGFNFLVELSALDGSQRLRLFSQDIQSLAVY